MSQEYVTLKGSKDGVDIILSPDMPITILLKEIETKLGQAKDFFSKGSCNICFSGKAFSATEKLKLETTVKQVLIDCDISMSYTDDVQKQAPIFTSTKEGYTKFHEGTLRSGRLLESEGNMVIIGDVNPGAEVVAAGNIVVMGAVRGIIHAGCTGNRDAFIVALNMSPTQIRIADIITRPPDNEIRRVILPERAYIKDDTIYIDEYLTKM